MKSLIAVAASMLIASPAFAQMKPCEELKSEIEAKIKANGVPVFTLDIVPNEQVKEGEGKVVGTCDGSTQKIVYKRGVAEAPRDMPAKAQPEAPRDMPAKAQPK
jgi:uncharacterized protein DUF1161